MPRMHMLMTCGRALAHPLSDAWLVVFNTQQQQANKAGVSFEGLKDTESVAETNVLGPTDTERLADITTGGPTNIGRIA
eukprot:1160853-Pelagomonas_calceolata.AAC.6